MRYGGAGFRYNESGTGVQLSGSPRHERLDSGRRANTGARGKIFRSA